MTGSARQATAEAVTAAVTAERTRMVASLIRLTGDWDLAEDCVQDAAERALVHWPRDGMPRSPAAWLTTVARRRALDILRRHQNERAKLAEHAILAELDCDDSTSADPLSDDRLRLIFTCCHPALPLDGRVALTLKTVAGLSTAQIAQAFLVSEPAMAQRLLRTRQKIGHAAIPYRVPPPDLLAERTGGVLAVLYLIFNAGYGQPDDHLVTEALRLVRLLASLMPGEGEVHGLLALILFQLARRPARFDARGDLVPMEEQTGVAGTRRSSRPGWRSCAARRARDARRAPTGCRPRSRPATPRRQLRPIPPGTLSSRSTTPCCPSSPPRSSP